MIPSLLRFAAVRAFPSLLLVATSISALAAGRVEVAGELQRLAEAHRFVVTGLEQTSGSLGRAEGEELYPRLRRLLENFDHVIVQGQSGLVDRVIVLGEKVPFEPAPPVLLAPSSESGSGADGDIVLATERRGTQHLVRVSLGGKDGSRVERELQVDTGADYLVLPLSLVAELGVDKAALQEREMQTANGKIGARIGNLPFLWLGERRVSNVETAFLEGDKLGSSGLLGMSVLGRYKLTIDDVENSITLGTRGGGESAKEGKEE